MITENDIRWGLRFSFGDESGFVISEPIHGKVLYKYSNYYGCRRACDKVKTFLSLVNNKSCVVTFR